MEDTRKEADKNKQEYIVTMLIRGERYYYERFPVSAESAAHAIDQVIGWLRHSTESCEWGDFEFKGVEERRGGKKR